MMKRIALVLIFLPLTLAAQEPTVSSAKKQAEVASQAKAKTPSTDDGLSAALVPDSDGDSNPDPIAAQQPNAKPAQTAPPSGENRPKLPGSMVGYIDDPIPESQFRVRFDGAFDDQFPDRAEFFYGKCGCDRFNGSDPNAPGPPPGTAKSAIPGNINFQQLYVQAEFAPIRRFSLFAEVPVRWIEAEGTTVSKNGGTFPSEGGLSDVTAGFKVAAVASEGTYVTFQFTGYFPSGDALKGLGTNHFSVEPAVLFYHRLSGRMTLEGEVGDWHPIDGSAGIPTTNSEGFAGDVFFYGIGPSYTLYSGRRVRFAPVLEVVGWHVLSGFETGTPADGGSRAVDGTNIVNIKIGARTSIGPHSSFYIGYGHAVTSADWYDQIIRAEYRYTF
jgi:Putative MetA-pathway of phenol degradation